jgi:hypothetical protein
MGSLTSLEGRQEGRYNIATHRKACNLNNNNIKTKQKDYERNCNDDGSGTADGMHGTCANE